MNSTPSIGITEALALPVHPDSTSSSGVTFQSPPTTNGMPIVLSWSPSSRRNPAFPSMLALATPYTEPMQMVACFKRSRASVNHSPSNSGPHRFTAKCCFQQMAVPPATLLPPPLGVPSAAPFLLAPFPSATRRAFFGSRARRFSALSPSLYQEPRGTRDTPRPVHPIG